MACNGLVIHVKYVKRTTFFLNDQGGDMKRLNLVICLAAMVNFYGCGGDSQSSTPDLPDEPGTVPVCGNEMIEEGEACDDGNTANGDGCSSSCTVEEGWICPPSGADCYKISDKPDPLPTGQCGDGMRSFGEECDDGNTIDGDGCSSECRVETGYTCENGTCAEITPAENCGNGVVDDGEVCDDGNTVSGDGCMSNCMRIEEGYECPPYGGMCALTGTSVCGDGILSGAEACDDGNNIDGDGCSAECKLERGYVCPQGEACHTVCGDWIIAGDEECDDGNHIDTQLPVSGDGCSAECKLEPGFDCTTTTEGYTVCKRLYCGDGIVSEELGEECDVPDERGATYGWSAQRHEAYCTTPEVNPDTFERVGGCHFTPYCGDGIVQAEFGEECDLGMKDEDGSPMGGDDSYGGCMSNCKRAGYCGDGILSPEEACDDGNTVSGDGCAADCRSVEEGYSCILGVCERLSCGNGVHDSGEQCDDGNFKDGDGCFNCRAEAGYMCEYSNPKCPDEVCKTKGVECAQISVLYGDGKIQEGFETCDDGNTIDGDGCTQGEIDPGYVCPTPGKRCVAASCGDGILAYGEECDDGNVVVGDGCSNRCKLELGYACATPGAPCAKGTCGDGIVQAGEECDDHNNTDKDGCSSQCIIEVGYKCPVKGGACIAEDCGDGKINEDASYRSYEECDLGASLNGAKDSGCSSVCQIETGYHCDDKGQNCAKGVCGDGILDVGEECDDGNMLGGDGCNPECIRETIFECNDNDCKPVCGDGVTMWMAGEECDDGNLTNGDGCSSECKVEVGFTCTDFKGELPKTIDVPVTYRDFIYYDEKGSGDGYLTVEEANDIRNYAGCAREGYVRSGYGFPDFQRFNGNGCKGMVENELDEDGKPVFTKTAEDGKIWTHTSWKKGKSCLDPNPSDKTPPNVNSQISCPRTFWYWYRDVPGVNKSYPYTLRMGLTDRAKGVYSYDYTAPPEGATGVTGDPMQKGQFCPLNGTGYSITENANHTNHGGFTSEIHTYFQYQGGEQLRFKGDDDVWVFVNNKLFVDLGGMQSGNEITGTLGKEEYVAGKDADGKDIKMHKDSKLGLYQNGIYDIKMFHAERNMGSSFFNLQLAGFLNVGKAQCASTCGDGITAADEQCDIKGHVDDDYAKFKGCVQCKKTAVCGNGVLEPGEACDPGHMCKDVSSALCAEFGITYKKDDACNEATCKYDSCGDGTLNAWEQCDCKDGKCQFAAGYDVATAHCLSEVCKVATCGDGIVSAELGEECDNGDANGDNAECSKTCKLATCGDGIVQAFRGEICDLGTDKDGNSLNTGAYGANGKPGCSMDCRFETPYCGDGRLQKSSGEQCDDGEHNDDNQYNGCTTQCHLGPRCGDGIVQSDAGESCDLGDQNGAPGSSCTKSCSMIVN